VGSKTGWILALAVILAVVIVLWIVILDPQPSLPRETNADGFLDLKKVAIPLGDVIGFTPSAPGNAAEDYQKAVNLWISRGKEIDAVADAERYDALVASEDMYKDPALQAAKQIADHVAAGAKKQKMEYSFVYSPKTLTVGYHHAHSTHLWKVSVTVHLLHNLHKDRKEYAQAEEQLKHMFVLGWHMLNERRLAQVERDGVEIMTVALQRFQELYGVWREGRPGHRMGPIKEYDSALRLVSDNFRRKKKILWDNIPARDPVTNDPALYPGDVFNVVKNDQDRAWRVQGVIALGPLKHLVTSRGDIKECRRLIKRSLASKDPIIEAAAKAADAMDRDAFRSLGSDFSDEETGY